MFKKVIIQAILLMLLVFSIAFGYAAEAEPPLPDKSIFSPTIQTISETAHAGTAWAMGLEGKDTTIIVTAHHIFGPDGGLSSDIPAEAMAANIRFIDLKDDFTGKHYGKVTKNLYIPGSKSMPPINKDVAAFLVDKKMNISKLYVSDQLPRIGETVWLAATVASGAPEGVKLHKAVVLRANQEVIAIAYDNSALVLNGTSGAPILNKEGKVIGVNIGAKNRGGMLIGLINPCTSFKKMIVDSLANIH